MNVGLIDIEPKVFNTAYMQIAAYHKGRGDEVSWWSPLTDAQFDVVYCSSIFDFTDKTEVPERAICGGTGFDISSRLSQEMERCDYDYSIYPKCDRSIVWFSRGCVRKCPFCVVWEKEGPIRPVEAKPLNPKGKYIVVQDNNFFANPLWAEAMRLLREWAQPVDFQGIDARSILPEHCKALKTVRHYKQIKISWDNPKEHTDERIKLMLKFIPAHRLMCYVLIGYWSTEAEDLYRVETLRGLGIDPFVMPYNKKDLYQRAFARWVNHKAIFKTASWNDYKKEKGIETTD